MDINNSGNISKQIAQSISKLNLNGANRKLNKPVDEKKQEDFEIEEVSNSNISEVKKSSKSLVDVQDIQKYADYMGEKLTIDDINYGLMYGRSVIADYSV